MHSTARGPAIGGCRIKPYRSVGDGVADALRLSRAMTLKCGLAELPHGGGKSVVVLGDAPLTPPVRENPVLDIAETNGTLDGRYRTGPDIGITPQDMAVIGRLTPGWAFCRPEALGGSGNSSAVTARGVRAALDAAVAQVRGTRAVTGPADRRHRLRQRRQSPGPVAGRRRRRRGRRRPGRPPPSANNQLTGDEVVTLLHERGITWIPDTVASAGGIIHAVCREEPACDERETDARVDAIGAKVDRILAHARTHGTPAGLRQRAPSPAVTSRATRSRAPRRIARRCGAAGRSGRAP
ncbi:Glu/Leu/Phe/Val dehydrogenase dimerization domain-containing protein [Nonomuraea fuscirosea]